MNRFVIFIALSFVLFSCGQTENKSSLKSSDTVEPKAVVVKDTINELNDIADLISGKSVRKESKYFAISKTDAWKKYSEESEKAWANFKTVADKYNQFYVNNLQSSDTIKTLLYPFSGPDFLFANLLFPKVENMILMGLESPGSVPSFNTNDQDSLNKIFDLYRLSILDVVQLSFFRTVDMKVELGNKAIDGTTPILMLFLARSGKEIVSVKKSYFNENGQTVETADNKKANAVVIEYKVPGESKIRKITYLSTNIADPSVKENKAVMQFLKNIETPTLTFVKSATYLMHKPYFSVIRNVCLKKSAIILQDDSGIAFHYFKKGEWSFRYFGSYTKPIDMFSMFYQEDYAKAFKQAQTKPLNFRAGYNRNSNLLIAIRK